MISESWYKLSKVRALDRLAHGCAPKVAGGALMK